MSVPNDRLLRAWAMVLLIIPLLSAFGRPLQQWVLGFASSLVISIVLSGLLLFAVIYFFHSLWQQQRSLPWLHLPWIIGLFVILPLQLPYVEERLHFIVFGLLGYLSLRRFTLIIAVGVVMIISGLDELFQWWLPMRVGDWRDVAMNMLAGFGGMGLAWLGRSWALPKEQL